MTSAARKTAPAVPGAWTLRDEIAMRVLPALLSSGEWGRRMEDGTFRKNATVDEHSRAAYNFADAMLRAREEA